MGVFDNEGLFREKAINFGFHGDGNIAQSHAHRVHKIVETMQGILDLGHNEGMIHTEFQLTNDTRVFVKIYSGATSPIWRVDIVSTPEAPPELEPPPYRPEINEDCPLLPLSRPGVRMFSQMLDCDIQEECPSTFEKREVPIVKTPYIVPTLEQGHYCAEGTTSFHGEIKLSVPFRFGGADVETVYVHWGWIGFVAPQVGLDFDRSSPAKNAPCTLNPLGSPAFTPDIDLLTPGNSGVISMVGNVTNPCQSLRPGECWLVEGKVIIGEKLASGGDADDFTQYPESLGIGQGDARNFAIFSFIGDGEQGLNQGEREIVLLYSSDECNAAIGLFYGGEDGAHPWAFSDGYEASASNLDINPPCKGHYLTSLLCQVAGGDGAEFIGPRCGIPINSGGLIIGGERQGYAWIEGLGTFEELLGEMGAKTHLNSRSFWFELDMADGIPNGLGLHNGPIVLGDEELAMSNNAVDLGFP